MEEQYIKRIESLLAEGEVIELRKKGSALLITHRPETEYPIKFPSAVYCSDNPCNLNIMLQNPYEEPVALASFPLPAGYWLEEIRGYKGGA